MTGLEKSIDIDNNQIKDEQFTVFKLKNLVFTEEI